MTIRAVVTEDWQRDAIQVILVDHDAHRVSIIRADGYLPAPMLEMSPYVPDEVLAQQELTPGILLPLTVARELYEALGRHFGDHQDPASRELVDTLKATVEREGARVDKLLDYATAPPVIVDSVRP